MKYSKYTAIILSCILFNITGYSQDTNAIKYLPLKVGNSWVYYFTGEAPPPGYASSGYDRYTITGTTVVNGKTYFVISLTRVQITGTYTCSPRLFMNNSPIRVDSLSGNIYRNAVCLSNQELLVDSLRSKLRDTATFCPFNQESKSACKDTSGYMIFGNSMPSKKFENLIFEGGNAQIFVKNIGLVYYNYGLTMSHCETTLRGCVINGVLYGDTSITSGVTYTISGRVRYQDNVQPVNSGYVKALKHVNGNVIRLDSTQINSDGTYTLLHVPQDSTDLMAFQNDEENMDYVPTYYPSTITWQNAVTLYPTSNLTNINIDVYRIVNDGNSSHKIMGKVMSSADSTPLPYSIVYAKLGNIYKAYSVSKGDGSYAIDSLPSGAYQLVCDRLDFYGQTRNITLGNSNLSNIDFYMEKNIISVNLISTRLPGSFYISQNYPNPFNPSTSFEFGLPKTSKVRIAIYDMLGREVSVLVNSILTAGTYKAELNATDYASGVYLYRFESDDFADTKKMVLMK